MSPRADWRRTQFVIIVSVFVFYAGMNFVMPFLPLYAQELSDLSLRETAVWSGLILAATPLVSGVVSPLWGLLADRWGRKLILMRSLLGFSVALALMGVATSVWHLLAIRAMMGFFAGFTGVAAAFISNNNPRDQLTSGIGKLHAVRVLGLAIGPLPGGVLADLIGSRNACFVSMSMGLAAFFIVLVFAREDRRMPEDKQRQAPRKSARTVITRPAFLSSFAVVLATRLVERAFDPLLPLIIAHQGVEGIGVATATAIIASSGMFASAAAAALVGRYVKDSRRTPVLLVALLFTVVTVLPVLIATTWVQLLVIRVMVGICIGMTNTLTYSLTASETPRSRRGLTLSVLGTGSSVGSSIGLLSAGFLSAISLTLVFAVGAVAVGGAAVGHVLARRGPQDPEPPDEPRDQSPAGGPS